MRVRPRSSEKNAWLLSPPSTVLLFSSPETPRKLIKPKVWSGTEPGVRRAKSDHRRPLIGSSLIDIWLIFVVNSLDSVLTAPALATMSTAADAAPTRNTASTSLKRPTSTANCSSLNSENPVAEIVIAYVPGCRLVKRKRPALSVVTVSVLLVPILRNVTDAFATAALFGSVAAPPTAPVTADWPSARLPTQAIVNANRMARPAKRTELILNICLPLLLRMGNNCPHKRFGRAPQHTARASSKRVSLLDWFIPAGSLGRRAGPPYRPLVVSIRMAWGSTDRHDSVMLYCGYKLKLKQGVRVNQGSGKVKLSECQVWLSLLFRFFL